jgi:hypothetical protein
MNTGWFSLECRRHLRGKGLVSNQAACDFLLQTMNRTAKKMCCVPVFPEELFIITGNMETQE